MIERRIFDACLWLVVACLLMAFLTSCSPYLPQTATATPAPGVTATAHNLLDNCQVTPTPRPSCRVSGQTVYLRPSPSRAGDPLAVLHYGQILEVIERGAWLKVSTLSHEGFLHSKFCQE
jgi:hypothetical protein